MTLLALGAKCGALDRPGSAASGGAWDAKRRSSSRLSRAMLPIPKPDWRKKWRRVTSLSTSLGSPTQSLLGERLIEVQDDVRHHRPGGSLSQGDLPAVVPRR